MMMLAKLEMNQTEDKLIRPDCIAEIPDIETKANYKDIMGPQLAAQSYKPTVAQQAVGACHSAGRAKSLTATSKGVNDDDVSATMSVVDLTDNHMFLSDLSTSVK